jgi:hypothetical protein
MKNAGLYKAGVLLTLTTDANYRATARGGRPPPWLALPPLLAISRCFAGSIAAKPRFDPLVLVAAIMGLPHLRTALQRYFQAAVHLSDTG